MPDVGWICMLHPVITNPLRLQLCYFHYKPLLFTTTLFPAELSSGSGFSSCAISLPVCVGTVPHQSLFGGTARSSTLLPTSQGCVQHVTCATSIVPRLGGFVPPAALSLWQWQESCALLSPQAGGWIWGVNPNQGALCTTKKERGGQPGLLMWLFQSRGSNCKWLGFKVWWTKAGVFNISTSNKTLGLQKDGGLKSPSTVLALPLAFPVKSRSGPGLLALKSIRLRLGDVWVISDAGNLLEWV